jgi:ubiquinone/menaquinone biosynthesis C-methylase UbiE
VFDKTADLYDLLYLHKDYAAEAAWVTDAVRSRAPSARSLLDVACGTGKHLEHLRKHFDCEGLDVNPRFVAIATERTGVPVHLGDMDAFDLGRRFDAVVSLFSSIGYSQDLSSAITAMARHANPGGVVIVEPWFRPEEWLPGTIGVLDREAEGLRVVRMALSGTTGQVATIEAHHLVGTASGIEHVAESHRLTLFTSEQYEAAFRSAGLSYEVDQPGPFGRGAIIGSAGRR